MTNSNNEGKKQKQTQEWNSKIQQKRISVVFGSLPLTLWELTKIGFDQNDGNWNLSHN